MTFRTAAPFDIYLSTAAPPCGSLATELLRPHYWVLDPLSYCGSWEGMEDTPQTKKKGEMTKLFLTVTMATKLYYYTTKDDYSCIYNLGLIWTYCGTYGEGVYLTDVHPKNVGMEVVKHSYAGQQREYPDTEVCLETSADKFEANKINTNSGDKIWISKSQLLFSYFEFGYFWSGKSAWNTFPLSSQIKLEHRTLCVTKSPLSQLKELLDRQGLMSDFKFEHINNLYVCTATYQNKIAVATGRTKKSSKHEAAKCLIRQILLENKNSYSLMFEQLGSNVVKERAHESTVQTKQTTSFIGENKRGNNLIKMLQDITLAHSSPVRTFKHCNSDSMAEINNPVSVATEIIQHFNNSGKNSGVACSEDNFVNNFATKSLQESNVLTIQRAGLHSKNLRESSHELFAKCSLSSVHEQNVAKIRSPIFRSETEEERSRNSHISLSNAGICGTACNEGNALNKTALVCSHESSISENLNAEIRIFLPGENNCVNYLSGKLQDIRIENSSPLSAHKPVTPENTTNMGTSSFEPVAENITSSENRNHSPYTHSVGKSGATCNGDNVVNKIVKKDSQALNNSINNKADIRFQKILETLKEKSVAQSSPVPTYRCTTSENTRTTGSSFFGSKTGDIAESDIGRRKIVTNVVSPAESTRAGSTTDPLPRSSSPGSDTEVRVFQEAKDVIVASNYVGNLQCLCDGRGWSHPKYEGVQSREADRGAFFIDCVLRGFCERGTGYSKKQAKQHAAMKILKRVKYLEPSDSQKGEEGVKRNHLSAVDQDRANEPPNASRSILPHEKNRDWEFRQVAVRSPACLTIVCLYSYFVLSYTNENSSICPRTLRSPAEGCRADHVPQRYEFCRAGPVACGELLQGELALAHVCTFSVHAAGASNRSVALRKLNTLRTTHKRAARDPLHASGGVSCRATGYLKSARPTDCRINRLYPYEVFGVSGSKLTCPIGDATVYRVGMVANLVYSCGTTADLDTQHRIRLNVQQDAEQQLVRHLIGSDLCQDQWQAERKKLLPYVASSCSRTLEKGKWFVPLVQGDILGCICALATNSDGNNVTSHPGCTIQVHEAEVLQAPSRTVGFTRRFHTLSSIQAKNTSLSVVPQSPVVVHPSLRSRTLDQTASIKDCRPLGCSSASQSHQNILASSLKVSQTLAGERRSVTPASLAAVAIQGIPRRWNQETASASFHEEGSARWVSDYGAGQLSRCQLQQIVLKSVTTADNLFGTVIEVPRQAKKQTARNNHPHKSVEQYYLRYIFLPCVDGFNVSLQQRICRDKDILSPLEILLPKHAHENCVKELE
ncbi:hypothetical protein PR048_000387 [Dryococelus australis]|uniref:DRBM domain-containing protein n=1 Tax=Dryococelus australis TaxID=614101 RepID=A0ABQ9IEG4_9NEOP|nr:hypothetical protein PR048_000387 [Dryococelus australis]